MGIAAIKSQIAEQSRLLADARAKYEQIQRELEGTINDLQSQYQVALDGHDIDRINEARKILYIRGDGKLCGDDMSAINDAILWLSGTELPGRSLRAEYFGTKNYDRWCHQRSDHSYGYGPRHGYTVFAIGLRNPMANLTDKQRDSCIYYLELYKRGKIPA